MFEVPSWLSAIQQTNDDGYIVAGSINTGNNRKIWLTRLGSDKQAVELASQSPSVFTLIQAYPNPFNSSANISFVLPYSGKVNLIVYDSNGREVESMLGELFPAGNHRIFFDASQLLSGIYFAKLNVNGRNHVQKLVLIK